MFGLNVAKHHSTKCFSRCYAASFQLSSHAIRSFRHRVHLSAVQSAQLNIPHRLLAFEIPGLCEWYRRLLYQQPLIFFDQENRKTSRRNIVAISDTYILVLQYEGQESPVEAGCRAPRISRHTRLIVVERRVEICPCRRNLAV